jgi:hypothetical protein
LLLLNPPYDWESGADESARKEYTFLREASPALVSGGVLVYIVPDTRLTRKVVTIEGIVCYPEEAEAAARASPVFSAFRRSVVPEEHEMGAGQPPTPLHKGHISLLLAAGHLDGLVGEGPNAHLVRGTVAKEERELSGDDGDDGKLTRTLITHRITIKALTPRGEVKTLT